MITFAKKRQTNQCKNFIAQASSSTFLIPQMHMDILKEKMRQYDDDLSSYLRHLLSSYRFLLKNGLIPKHEFLKTGYQGKDLNLQRIDFVPLAEDWAELKCLKAFFNRSMNWIFVFLLLLDSLDLSLNLPTYLASFVVPKITQFRENVIIQFSRKRLIYTRVLQMTRDKIG